MKQIVFFMILAWQATLAWGANITLDSGLIVKGRIIELGSDYIKMDVEGVELTFYAEEIKEGFPKVPVKKSEAGSNNIQSIPVINEARPEKKPSVDQEEIFSAARKPLKGDRGNKVGETCSGEPTIFMGQEFYQECYCEGLEYPQLVEAGNQFGIDVISDMVACTEHGCRCGVVLKWKQKPNMDLQDCVAYKQKALKELDSIGNISKNLAFLTCGSIAEDNCMSNKDPLWCSMAQDKNNERGLTDKAEMFRNIKCSIPVEERSFTKWDKYLDCEGMKEYLKQKCDAGTIVAEQQKACDLWTIEE